MTSFSSSYGCHIICNQLFCDCMRFTCANYFLSNGSLHLGMKWAKQRVGVTVEWSSSRAHPLTSTAPGTLTPAVSNSASLSMGSWHLQKLHLYYLLQYTSQVFRYFAHISDLHPAECIYCCCIRMDVYCVGICTINAFYWTLQIPLSLFPVLYESVILPSNC